MIRSVRLLAVVSAVATAVAVAPLLVAAQEADRPIVIRNVTVIDGTGAADFTRRAQDAGVVIAAGTDGLGEPLAGELPNVHTELQLLVELAGLTPLQALTAGTLNGARAIGVQARLGSVEVGKVADLVLLSADPSLDIGNTRDIEHVFLGGRVIR